MPDNINYEYAVIRIVPKVEREEFMNVGVLLYAKRKKYLGIKYVINQKRLDAFAQELDLEALQAYLHGWELVCQGGKQGGRIGQEDLAFRFRWLTAPRSTIIQSSRPHPGLCQDPEQVLEDLFKLYVL